MSFINECAEEERIEESGEIIESSSELKENRNLIIYVENSTRTRSIAREYFGLLKDSEKGIV